MAFNIQSSLSARNRLLIPVCGSASNSNNFINIARRLNKVKTFTRDDLKITEILTCSPQVEVGLEEGKRRSYCWQLTFLYSAVSSFLHRFHPRLVAVYDKNE